MRAGKLRRFITITETGTTRDEYNQPVPGASTPVLSAKASIAAISGKEVYAVGAGYSGQLSHVVIIRFPAAAIRSGMTVVYGTRNFTIQAVLDPDESGRELHLVCLEQQ